MYNITAPKFPLHIDTETQHVSTVVLPAFAGTQYRNGPYGALSAPGLSNGEIHAVGDKSLATEDFRKVIEFVIKNDAAIRDALLESLVDHYNENREVELDCLAADVDPHDVLPEIQNSGEMLPLCGVVAIHVGAISNNGDPQFGIELGCNWESDDGAGAMFSGIAVVSAGGSQHSFIFPPTAG